MLIVAPPAALRLVFGPFLQVEFQSVHLADGVKTVPWFAERKAELVVERDRAFKVIDKELARRTSPAASSRWSSSKHPFVAPEIVDPDATSGGRLSIAAVNVRRRRSRNILRSANISRCRLASSFLNATSLAFWSGTCLGIQFEVLDLLLRNPISVGGVGIARNEGEDILVGEVAGMAVFPFRHAQSLDPRLIGDGAVVPANNQDQPVGFLDPPFADFDGDLPVAAPGRAFHRDFEKLDAVAILIRDLLDDA